MNKIKYLTLSGTFMGLAGVCMLLSENLGAEIAKLLVPVLFGIGGVMALLFSEANKQHNIARQYHLLQGVGMIVFAILIGLIPGTLGEFLQYVTHFMLLFGLVEVLFGFTALNTGTKLNMGILISRFIAGIFNLVGALLILTISAVDEISGLLVAGILVLIGGIAFVIFSLRIRRVKPIS
ncbi:MAG: hypothetical protein AAF632_15195 [Bacteroidota bacterium]